MKASVILALSGSLLAAANPVMKRAIFTTYETTTVLKTVTVDPPSQQTPNAKPVAQPVTSKKVDPIKQQQQKPQKSNPIVTPSSVVVPTSVKAVPTTLSSLSPASKVVASSAPSSSPSGSGTNAAADALPSDFKSTVLYHHNIHRQNHSASDLTYNDEIAGYAAITAAKCVFAHDMTEGSGKYGQNIAYSSTNTQDKNNDVAQAITDLWYNSEVSLYPSNLLGVSEPSTANFKTWGHFTQIIWKSTTEVGCAVQLCKAGTISSLDTWFAVCNYRSQGNMNGQYAANTGASLNKPSISSSSS